MVMISTDKAVRPTNIMGASKRLAEMALQSIADQYARQEKSTRFCLVRFGNVLGSSGSVVPKFREQLKLGGPITLTHTDVTRYFMTIPEAAQLVLQASAMQETHRDGARVYILDMGESVKIIDLAKLMIRLSGLTVNDESNPSGDIALQITGLRPGEKLYEELLTDENAIPTRHSKIYSAEEPFSPLNEILGFMQTITKPRSDSQLFSDEHLKFMREKLRFMVQFEDSQKST
jgi:FlaA1/EpsC-like NDP-sugar epimerase